MACILSLHIYLSRLINNLYNLQNKVDVIVTGCLGLTVTDLKCITDFLYSMLSTAVVFLNVLDLTCAG